MEERPTPTRPNRTGKTPPRENSSLLMSVIRTLSNSDSNEQREVEKKRLEKEFKKSDARLDTFVVAEAESLKRAMHIFGAVSSRLAQSQERLRAIKENLSACKHLLHCKRDELKERWLEGIELKHAMLLLEQIEEVQDVGDRVGSFLNKKHYLHATKLLMSSLRKLETDLKMIEAMREVHMDLLLRKEKLHEALLEDLHKHLYQRWTREVLLMRRQGSGRDSFNNLSRNGSERAGSIGFGPTKIERPRKNLLEAFNNMKNNGFSDSIEEDVTTKDPEENSQRFTAIIIECLALLGKLPEAVEAIKGRMQNELSTIIQSTTRHMLEMHPSPGVPEDHEAYIIGLHRRESREAKLLQELLQTVFGQFQLVVRAHSSLLESIKLSSDKHGIELYFYTLPDVWSKVQAALQLLLNEYIVLSSLSNQQQAPTTFSETTTDISSFFSKKRPTKTKSFSLFKFDASYHAITMNSYLVEQAKGKEDITDGKQRKSRQQNGQRDLICTPSPHNITAIFNILQSFIKEIEEALGYKPGTRCPLSVFVTDYVKDAFLAQLHIENAGRLEHATKALDHWKLCKDVHTLKTFKVTRPLLQSTITVWQSIEDLHWLLSSLPLFADHFVSMMCNTLLNYKETCQAAYRGITQPESEDKRIISATWAKDEDIKRFLRDLPNWQALQAGVSTNLAHEENPQTIEERNRKEAEILTGNLGEQLIPEHEILSDPQQLRTLAHLQESLEWFANCIMKFASTLPLKSQMNGTQVPGDVPPVSDASVVTLTSLAKDFEELSQTCLLVLHLEVRLHCFYYLLPVGRASNFVFSLDSQEPDGEVLKLNKDLAVIDETLSSTLQVQKCKYIFEGLGPLLSNIVMAWSSQIRRINGNGIKKICRDIFCIQQQLTNITMTRELALDKARQFYELLYLTPEEILNNIVNRGQQFTELEYINGLQLIYKSYPGSPPENLQANLQRLSEILGDVGVTV